jgi:hypothetical protein
MLRGPQRRAAQLTETTLSMCAENDLYCLPQATQEKTTAAYKIQIRLFVFLKESEKPQQIGLKCDG